MVRKTIKKLLNFFGINQTHAIEAVGTWSIKAAIAENKLGELVRKLRAMVPDISKQEERGKDSFNDFCELKKRGLHAFQCKLMLKSLEEFPKKEITVVDIGDSAGTHMLYLKELTRDSLLIDAMGVNLDPRAIAKIKSRGQKAILCRAEDLDLGDKPVDLFTSFEMVEHLHNPAIFFKRLAKRPGCEKMVITVPYLKQSRVGLHHVRNHSSVVIFAEDEHIFELSPKDWTLLFLHGGWNVIHSQIYYQYPRRWPILSFLLKMFWRRSDYEGFWGAILEKDTSICDCYKNWES